MTSQRTTDWFSPPRTLTEAEWPPDYVSVFGWRQQQVRRMLRDPALLAGAREYYRTRPAEFICHWVDTYDPRIVEPGRLRRMPMVLFRRQQEFVEFLHAVVNASESGLAEKCRDVGATWLCCGYSVHAWLFRYGSAVGWGSRKADLVDKIGVPDSIFEKLRMIVRGLPPVFLPEGFVQKEHMTYMRILNPENDSTIIGESGDDIGRGGRTLVYFKDESAHYERPELIEASLGENTRSQIDISSVCGIGNVFHRKREAGADWDGETVHRGQTNVFVFDWRDHPEKTQEWYDTKRRKHESEGLLHVFAQEVDRDYAASVTGSLIPLKWIQAAVDAHLKLDIDVGETEIAGLDVADGIENGDTNALVRRRGILLHYIDEWGGVDTGVTTRRTVDACRDGAEVQYDCIGVGAGVKSESNRLSERGNLPSGVRFVAWSAGAKVLEPDEHVIPDDEQSPLNKDFYMNLKAQGWWQLRLRFERTYKRVIEGVQYPSDSLISISSEIPTHLLRKLEKELAQVTRKYTTGSLKMVIDKTPEGTRSPNIADGTVMAYWPLPNFEYRLDSL